VDVKVKLVSDDAVMPTYACKDDGGGDLAALYSCSVMPGEIVKVRTGIAIELPPGYVGLLFARSGYAARGLALANGVGVIDAGYRGEIIVPMINLALQPHHISAGSRIAQLIPVPAPFCNFLPVDSLSDSERGDGGFGHTGL